MKLLPTITTEDRWVIGSIALTLSRIILGARLAEPRAFGITALIVIALLFIAFSVTHSLRLSWLLLFGLVAGVMELWADWVHVVYFHSLVYTDYKPLHRSTLTCSCENTAPPLPFPCSPIPRPKGEVTHNSGAQIQLDEYEQTCLQ